MNPSARNSRRFRVHLVPIDAPDSMYIKFIEEAKDLDELEFKLKDYCYRRHLFVRSIEEIDE